MAYELGMTAVFLPEFDRMMETPQNNPHHCYNVGEHTLKALEFCEADKVLRLAALCHDFGKPDAKTTQNGVDHFRGHPAISEQLAAKALRRLKFDNDTIEKVKVLVRLHDAYPRLNEETLRILHAGKEAVTKKTVRRLMFCAGKDLFPKLMQLCGADVLAQSDYRKTEKLLLLEQIYCLYEQIVRDGECLSLKELAVGGKDLIAAGVKPGKELGEILNRMLEDVLDEPEHNKKEYLMECYIKR